MQVAPLTITPNNPLAKILFPVPITLCSASLEVLVLNAEVLLKGYTTMISLNQKLMFLSNHFNLLMPLNQWVKKVVTVLAGVVDPRYKGEICPLLHNEGNKEYIWKTEDLLQCLLALSWLRSLEIPTPNRQDYKSSKPFSKEHFGFSGKEPQPAEVLAGPKE